MIRFDRIGSTLPLSRAIFILLYRLCYEQNRQHFSNQRQTTNFDKRYKLVDNIHDFLFTTPYVGSQARYSLYMRRQPSTEHSFSLSSTLRNQWQKLNSKIDRQITYELQLHCIHNWSGFPVTFILQQRKYTTTLSWCCRHNSSFQSHIPFLLYQILSHKPQS